MNTCAHTHTCAHTQFLTSLPHHSPCTSSSVPGCHLCPLTLSQFPKAPGKYNLFPFSDSSAAGSSHLDSGMNSSYVDKTHSPLYYFLKPGWPPLPRPVPCPDTYFSLFLSGMTRQPFISSSKATSQNPPSMHFTHTHTSGREHLSLLTRYYSSILFYVGLATPLVDDLLTSSAVS